MDQSKNNKLSTIDKNVLKQWKEERIEMQKKAIEQLAIAEQRADQMKVEIERLNGALFTIDELLKLFDGDQKEKE